MLYIAHADDQEIIRNAVASYFKAQEDVTLILQASCGEELLVGLNGVDVNAVVIDWNMPGLCGSELLLKLRNSFPLLPVIVYSAGDKLLVEQEALLAGASSFVSKNGPPSSLIEVINRLHSQLK